MTENVATVRSILATLRKSPVLPRPDGEKWAGMIERISTPGYAAEIEEAVYEHFLEVLPPQWMGWGFMFAEGAEPLRYFWEDDGRFFCRKLTQNETAEFCVVAGIPVPT